MDRVTSVFHRFLMGRAIGAGALDAAAFTTAAAGAWWWFEPRIAPVSYALYLGAFGLTLFLVLLQLGAYRADRAHRRRTSLLRIAGVTTSGLVLLPAAHLAETPELLQSGAGLAVMSSSLLALSGAVSERLLARPGLAHRILIVGSGDLARRIARGIERHRLLGGEVAGFLGEGSGEPDDSILGYPVLGRMRDAALVLREFEIDRVVLAVEPTVAIPEDALLAAKLAGLPIEPGPSFFEQLYRRVYLGDAPRRRLLYSEGFRSSRSHRFTKRGMDLLLSSAGLLVGAPLLALAALAIKLDSPGPVLYSQVRAGRLGRPFRLWKLRTMCVGAERATGAAFTAAADPRVTRVGRLLRKSRIDEIPQLWNVLRGEMSIVGPRPERPEFVAELSARYPLFRHRTSIRPGITGWAQVQQGYVADWRGFEEKLSYDLYYMQHRSISLDLLILWHTLKTLILLRGR
jgi:exopolysaccharide biosynthesis polyprenyl glycosylphosphotransferase